MAAFLFSRPLFTLPSHTEPFQCPQGEQKNSFSPASAHVSHTLPGEWTVPRGWFMDLDRQMGRGPMGWGPPADQSSEVKPRLPGPPGQKQRGWGQANGKVRGVGGLGRWPEASWGAGLDLGRLRIRGQGMNLSRACSPASVRIRDKRHGEGGSTRSLNLAQG